MEELLATRKRENLFIVESALADATKADTRLQRGSLAIDTKHWHVIADVSIKRRSMQVNSTTTSRVSSSRDKAASLKPAVGQKNWVTWAVPLEKLSTPGTSVRIDAKKSTMEWRTWMQQEAIH
ncbi:hypothetical protein V5O48_008462 [Marasmius crinis-equi]|uniref:Uncharacterized protein n=1 Tax=Marasmius crinis-equi TaxID=585013 RepID=A0ABR3FE15_9AGAR